MNDAKRHGYTVDEPVLKELTKWVAQSGDGQPPRPPNSQGQYESRLVGLGWLRSTPDAESQKAMTILQKTVKHDQIKVALGRLARDSSAFSATRTRT